MDFNTRFYLIESIQQILKVYGEDCLLTGLDLLNYDFNSSNDLTLYFSKGKVIVDSTLIEFPDDFDVTLNLNDLDDVNTKPNNFLVFLISFRYLRTSRQNQAIVSLKYIDSDITDDYLQHWFPERDRLILYKMTFDKSSKSINTVCSDYQNKVMVNINNREYQVKPFEYTVENLRYLLAQI